MPAALRLATLESGEGGRPLLLVHGYGGAKEDFADWMDPFATAGWHAVAPDLRGHGASPMPDGEESYDWHLYVADLLALADARGWRSFVLLGHSMGGMVAQHLVLDAPERVAALILMDTTHGATDWLDPDLMALADAVLRDEGVEAYVRLSKEVQDPLTTPAYERLLRERPDYEAFCDGKALATACDMRLSMMPKLYGQEDRLPRLAELEIPVLIVVGELDAEFVPHAERLAKTIPAARLEVIPEAGHSPQFETPEAWWAAVSSFLSEVAA